MTLEHQLFTLRQPTGKPVYRTQRKPRKWRTGEDGKCCIACDKPLKRGDMVFEDCVVCVHEGCLQLYGEQNKFLGIL